MSFDPSANGWTAINSTRGISRLILHDHRCPRPLPEQLMAGLFGRCDASELFSSGDTLVIGDHIRILSLCSHGNANRGPSRHRTGQYTSRINGPASSVLPATLARGESLGSAV